LCAAELRMRLDSWELRWGVDALWYFLIRPANMRAEIVGRFATPAGRGISAFVLPGR
jgi:hypothetical protein